MDCKNTSLKKVKKLKKIKKLKKKLKKLKTTTGIVRKKKKKKIEQGLGWPTQGSGIFVVVVVQRPD